MAQSKFVFPQNILEIQKQFLNLPLAAVQECVSLIQSCETTHIDDRTKSAIAHVSSSADLKNNLEQLWKALIRNESAFCLIKRLIAKHHQQ
jgi:hypothetical protein